MTESAIPKQTSQEFLRKFGESIDWMRSLGVNVDQGRLTNYRTAAQQWVSLLDEDRDRQGGLEHLPAITSAVYEVPQFLEIHAAFRGERIAHLGGLGAKLKKAIEGPVHLQNETEKSNGPRNFLFEAVTAARVHRPDNGSLTILNAPTDTGFTLHKSSIWVECKRLTSHAQLKSNVNKACRQLKRTIDKHPQINQRGLVALDISKLTTMPPPRYVFESPTEAEIGPRSQAIIDQYILDNGHVWEQEYADQDSRIIGTLLRLSLIAVSKDVGKYIFVHQWGVNPRRGIGIDDQRLLREAAKCFR
ncbi:hypothetical protein [Janthinobacterium sp. 13]|uniref:hypothetical protein n=1 Tax=Janthinobacterium sp. 13 TaxID=2035211 RepID=UPI000C6A3DDF|nr:hypothetical protein [Janthinobacterium sp. 13]PIF13284.1 hypothetical protein CLU94_5393 [Janthinobacterium sp. 13]